MTLSVYDSTYDGELFSDKISCLKTEIKLPALQYK